MNATIYHPKPGIVTDVTQSGGHPFVSVQILDTYEGSTGTVSLYLYSLDTIDALVEQLTEARAILAPKVEPKPDLFRDMGLTPEASMVSNVNKMFDLLTVQTAAALPDLSGNDAQVYTDAERRLEEPDGYEECVECGESLWREDMYSVSINDERYVCGPCMRSVANPGAR